MLIQSHFSGDSAALVPSRKWREKGLTYVAFGGKTVWTATQGLSPASVMAGTVKRYGSPYGEAYGFGSTYGAGATDRFDTTAKLQRPVTGWRSWFCNFLAIGSGGGSGGRICHPIGDTSMTTGEVLTLQFANIAFIMGASTQYGRWDGPEWTSGKWHAFGGVQDQRTVSVTPSLYFDGASASATLQQSAGGTYGTSPIAMSFGNRSTDNARNWDGQIGLVMFFDGQLSAAEHAALAKDPFQVFAPDELFVWIPESAGGDASASLAGSTGTSSTGTVAPSISASISGVSATSAVGSVSPSTGATASLSGTASTASVGSLSQSVTVAATGVQVSTASGVSTVGMSKDLTGNPSTASVGTLSPSVGATATLSGTATTTTTGSLAATLSITLGGVSTTASVGTLTLPGSYSAALNANQATASIGSIAPSVSNAIGGVQSATAVGASSSAGVSRSVTGNSSSANAGALAATLSVTVAGTSTSTAVGALSVPGSYSAELGSSAVSSLVGSLTTSVSVGVSGTLATTSVGTLTRTTAVIGSQTNTAVGALTVSVTNAVTGRSVIASSGSPLVAGGSFSASLYGNILATSSGLLTVLGAIPGPGESVNLYSRLATTKTLSSRIPQ